MQVLQTILDAIARLAGRLVGKANQETVTQTPLELRVLLVVFDPFVDAAGRVKLTQQLGWSRVDELIAGYVADIAECSNGLVKYRVIERHEVNEFPVKADSFTYTPQTFMDVFQRRVAPHSPDFVDYHKIAADFNLYQRVAANEFDEVWLFGFPYAGFYESRMAGVGSFWCNAPALDGSDGCPRRFVIMGFSYERGVGEMLESFGHRVESTLKQVFIRTQGDANLWDHYLRHDKTNPGMSEVGTLHYAPNSATDYDWGNRRVVPSRCDDWYNFPNFKGDTTARMVDCSEWGNGDIRLHHKWWLKHLPKLAGESNGIGHNWWAYVADPNNVQP